jgi:hypothetical protein
LDSVNAIERCWSKKESPTSKACGVKLQRQDFVYFRGLEDSIEYMNKIW